jgi:hypothetical protein
MQVTLGEHIKGQISEIYASERKSGVSLMAAAWHTPHGIVYIGTGHKDAFGVAVREHEMVACAVPEEKRTIDFYKALRDAGWKDGFLTSGQEFISREEALRVAREAGQIQRTIPIDATKMDSNFARE